MAKKKSKKKDNKKKDSKKKILKLKLRKKKDNKKKDKKKKDARKKDVKKKDLKKKEAKKEPKAKPAVVQVEEKKPVPPAAVAPKTPVAKPKAPVVKPKTPEIKNVDHSSNYNVLEAIKKLKAIKSTEELLAFTNGEKRQTITKAIPAAKARLEK
jgi:hypothetical protein